MTCLLCFPNELILEREQVHVDRNLAPYLRAKEVGAHDTPKNPSSTRNPQGHLTALSVDQRAPRLRGAAVKPLGLDLSDRQCDCT